MCSELGVSRQGYYAWRARQGQGASPRAARRAELSRAVEAVFRRHRGRYGAPRVWVELRREGWTVGMGTVASAMASLGLAGKSGRRGVPRTTVADPGAAPAPERLGRDFSPQAPDRVWATDITYLRTAEGWCYLAAIIDCYSRMVVGWALDRHMRTELCLAALDDATRRRRPGPGLTHHSDRGCQYTSHDYQKALAAHDMVASMSRKANCWDNAVTETLWATIKRELTDDVEWSSKEELEAALFEYIEIYYNRTRLHSTLDYMTPAEYDSNYWQAAQAA